MISAADHVWKLDEIISLLDSNCPTTAEGNALSFRRHYGMVRVWPKVNHGSSPARLRGKP